MVDAVVDHLADAGHHRREVDLGVADPDPELRGSVLDVVRDLCCPDQGLRGYAPTRDSGPADRPRLEEHHARAAPARLQRCRHPGHPAAENRNVDGFCAHRLSVVCATVRVSRRYGFA